MPEGWQIITLERWFENYFGQSLYKSIYRIQSSEERIKFIVEQTKRITGLKNFGVYLNKVITIDTVFLNENRHTHNIAVLLDEMGIFHLCPIFDNGAALLSDTTLDTPLEDSIIKLMKEVKAKTFTSKFDDQQDAIEKMYGSQVIFSFTKKDVIEIIDKEKIYDVAIKERVKNIVLYQMDKYSYLFH